MRAAPVTTTCSAAGPGGRPRPGHRRAGAAPVGPSRRSARAAHRRHGRAAGRSRHRHGARPGATRGAGGVRRLARCGPAHHRGARPRPGPRRRRRPARGLFTHPRDLPRHRRAAARRRSPTSAKPRGWPPRPATTVAPGTRAAQPVRRTWRSPIPQPRRRPPAPPPGTCAGPAPGASWRSRSATWPRRCCCSATGTPPTAELTQAVDSDGLADIEYPRLLPGLAGGAARRRRHRRGHAGRAARPAGQRRSPGQVDDQHRGSLHRRRPPSASRTRCATPAAVLAHADALGISHESLRWAWPLAARAAHDLGDTAATRELLALLDSYPPGHLAPMLRAERDLVRARLAARDGDQAAAASFAAAISGLRELSTPYHLAHGLLDHAQHLSRTRDADAAAAAIGEARDIARRLRCQPLLDRAADADAPQDPGYGPRWWRHRTEESAGRGPARAGRSCPAATGRPQRAAATVTRCATVICGCSSPRFSSTRSAAGRIVVVISVYIFDRTHSTQWLAAAGHLPLGARPAAGQLRRRDRRPLRTRHRAHRLVAGQRGAHGGDGGRGRRLTPRSSSSWPSWPCRPRCWRRTGPPRAR